MAARSAGAGGFNGLPSPSQAASLAGAGQSARDSPAPGASVGVAQRDPTKDLAVRKKILMDNPDLYALHVDLVRGGAMSEEEFWEGREVCLTYLWQRTNAYGLFVFVVYAASRICSAKHQQ